MGLNEQGLIRDEQEAKEAQPIPYGYQEIPKTDRSRLDVLEQMKANLRQIEDLNGRLSFLIGEVQGVLKKS